METQTAHQAAASGNAPAFSTEKAPRFSVGATFMHRKRLCTVVDIHTTRNLDGEIVRIGYVAAHAFMGQVITERDICETTVARNLVASGASHA